MLSVSLDSSWLHSVRFDLVPFRFDLLYSIRLSLLGSVLFCSMLFGKFPICSAAASVSASVSASASGSILGSCDSLFTSCE